MRIMGFFNLFTVDKKFDSLLQEAKNDKNGLLVDVRTEEEFSQGHVPGALNVPLDVIDKENFDKDLTLYLYCRSGARSSSACEIMGEKGYKTVNVGGIMSYTGPLER